MNEGNISPTPAPFSPPPGAVPATSLTGAQPTPPAAPPVSTPLSAPVPPWMQQPRTTPIPPAAPLAFASSAPAPVQHPQPATSGDEEKNWGPLKPIRKVPKPSDAKAAYILAQSEHVVLPEEDANRRKRVILGSIVGLVLIIGGSFAFITFGRDVDTVRTNTVQVVNAKVGNVNTSSVFPNANTATAPLDADGDGLSDTDEITRGTDARKSDTDGDGYPDGQEVNGGYNPLGPGKL